MCFSSVPLRCLLGVFPGYSEHFLIPTGCQTLSMPREALADPVLPPLPLPKWILINRLLRLTSFQPLPLIPTYPIPFFFSTVTFPLSVNNSCFQHAHTHAGRSCSVRLFLLGCNGYIVDCGFSKILIRARGRCEHPFCCLRTKCLPRQNTYSRATLSNSTET